MQINHVISDPRFFSFVLYVFTWYLLFLWCSFQSMIPIISCLFLTSEVSHFPFPLTLNLRYVIYMQLLGCGQEF